MTVHPMDDSAHVRGIGKVIADSSYFHISALDALTADMRAVLNAAISISGARPDADFNVVKINASLTDITLLSYPTFFEAGFPMLKECWTVNIEAGACRHRSYADSLNPPILHRKELLLSPNDPRYADLRALTEAAAKIGLFDDSISIGFLRNWEGLLSRRGYRVVGNELLPIGNEEPFEVFAESDSNKVVVERHLTALSRQALSAPMQSLLRLGLLNDSRTVFDYGCGRGGDIQALRELGIPVTGWDPHFAPNDKKQRAQIVNLGFVINVIEDRLERAEALIGAYELAEQVLVVSAMLASPGSYKGAPYGDGVLTSRRTFQKYFAQLELGQYIADTLREEPIAVGPGIFYVFKDKDEEQRFQYGRLQTRRNVDRLDAHIRRLPRATKVHTPTIYEKHRCQFDEYWRAWATLGRPPDVNDVSSHLELIAAAGSWNKVHKIVQGIYANDLGLVLQSRQSRISNLAVYFAKLQFERRQPYGTLERGLQQDVKAFFGSYRSALDGGRQLLLSLSNPEQINQACRDAGDRGLGFFTDSESLQLHSRLVEQLPPALRTYIECAAILFGDMSSYDIVKIHIRSSKVSLMQYDDFEGRPLPRLLRRIKINLRSQAVDVFEYGVSEPSRYLYRKSRFINEECPRYSEQLAFEDALARFKLLYHAGHEPTAAQFDEALRRRRLHVEGYRLVRTPSLPHVDDKCGRYLTYRDLVECGETAHRLSSLNLPDDAETYTALLDLALFVLDPVIEYFGKINLTFGYCSAALAKQIPGRIAPALDQHAGHGRKRNGAHICSRLGAACDFVVEDEDMEEVAVWVAANTPFDRLYFYGNDRPIHVSFGPDHSRYFADMRKVGSGRHIPSQRRDIVLHRATP